MPRARMPADLKARLAAHTPLAARGSHDAAETVRTWIFDGVLRDGDVISQDDLAELLGVSRIPVRDALIALAASGWVLLEPGVGARAVGLDEASVHDTLALMGTVWSLLARRMVGRGAPTERLIAVSRAVRAAAGTPEITATNAAFVDELRRGADSARLDAAYRNAARIVPGNFFEVVPRATERQRTYVPRLARAIARRDTDAAAGAALALHRGHAVAITQLLGRRGVLGSATGRAGASVSSV